MSLTIQSLPLQRHDCGAACSGAKDGLQSKPGRADGAVVPCGDAQGTQARVRPLVEWRVGIRPSGLVQKRMES